MYCYSIVILTMVIASTNLQYNFCGDHVYYNSWMPVYSYNSIQFQSHEEGSRPLFENSVYFAGD